VKSRSIALISSSYSPYIGGVEEHVAQVAKHLIERGHVVEVWTVDRGEGLGMTAVDGVAVRYLPAPLPARSLGAVSRFLVSFPHALRMWMNAVRTLKPDVLHVQCFGPNGLYAFVLHLHYSIPIVITSHGETLADDDEAFAQSALLSGGLKLALRAATAVTAPSQMVLSHLDRSFGLLHGTVIPNGVDLSVSPASDDEYDGLDAAYIVAVGRLGRMKGFDLLITAFAAAELPPDVRLIIVGDGPERGNLSALVEALGLSERVTFTGWRTPAGVELAMTRALAVAVPSRMEAFGIVALEAWRAGTALIMTNRGGASEFVRDGIDGVLVDPEDTAALARTLAGIATDPAQRARLTAAGLERVRGFTWSRVVERYESIYGLPSAPRAHGGGRRVFVAVRGMTGATLRRAGSRIRRVVRRGRSAGGIRGRRGRMPG
jgi:glycogen(starch) synthase